MPTSSLFGFVTAGRPQQQSPAQHRRRLNLRPPSLLLRKKRPKSLKSKISSPLLFLSCVSCQIYFVKKWVDILFLFFSPHALRHFIFHSCYYLLVPDSSETSGSSVLVSWPRLFILSASSMLMETFHWGMCSWFLCEFSGFPLICAYFPVPFDLFAMTFFLFCHRTWPGYICQPMKLALQVYLSNSGRAFYWVKRFSLSQQQ